MVATRGTWGLAGGVDGRPVTGLRNGVVMIPGRLQPGRLGLLNLSHGLDRSTAEGRTGLEIRDVGDPGLVLVAPEDVDVVVLHGSVPQLEIVSLDQLQELPQLVGLGLTPLGLQVDPLLEGGVTIDVMTAPDSVELEAQRLDQALSVGKGHIPEFAPGQALKKMPRIHTGDPTARAASAPG